MVGESSSVAFLNLTETQGSPLASCLPYLRSGSERHADQSSEAFSSASSTPALCLASSQCQHFLRLHVRDYYY